MAEAAKTFWKSDQIWTDFKRQHRRYLAAGEFPKCTVRRHCVCWSLEPHTSETLAQQQCARLSLNNFKYF
jgi:hypothetical protein